MRPRIVLLFTLVAGALYLFLWYGHVSWMGDDGFFLASADRILRGELPHRDFVIHFTPGSFYFLAGALVLFGNHWEVTRVVACTLVLIQGSAVFLLVRALSKSNIAAILGFFLILSPSAMNPVYNQHQLSATICLLTAWMWWLWQESGKLRYVVLAGFSDGLVWWVSQNKGALLAAAAVAISIFFAIGWARRLKLLGTYAAGVGIPLAGFLIFLWATGLWPEFHRQAVDYVLRNYTSGSGVPYGTTYASLDGASGFRPAVRTLYASWYFLVPLVALPTEAILFFRRRTERSRSGILLVLGTALFGAALHRPDTDHLLYVTHFPTVLCLMHLMTSASSPCRWLGRSAIGILALVSCIVVASIGSRTWGGIRRPRYDLVTHRDRAWTHSPPLAMTLEGLKGKLGEGDLFAFPHSSLYNRWLERPNPTRYDYLIEGVSTPQDTAEVLETLERKKVRYILLDKQWDERWIRVVYPRGSVRIRDGHLMEYVRANYVLEIDLPHAALYRRLP